MPKDSTLVLGSPIKDHAAPTALAASRGGAVAASGPSTVSGPVLAGGTRTAGALAAGSGSASGVHMATGAGVAAKTVAAGSLFGSLLYTAAMVGVGYLGYRAAKALWEKAAKKSAATPAV